MVLASEFVRIGLPLSLQPLFLLILLIISSIGPGLLIVRHLRWSPLEKLCGAIAASLVLLYLAAFAIYILRLPWESFYFVSLMGLAAMLAARRQVLVFGRNLQTRRALICFAVLVVWTVLHLSLIRHYSGGGWAGDWIEHYLRTGFFLTHMPLDTIFIKLYPLPARPPMMNLITGCFLPQVGTGVWHYQLVMTWLNLLLFFPCVLIASRFSRHGRRPYLLLTLALMCNPMFMQNATYAWTRLLTAFFVMLALHFYLRTWQKRDRGRLLAAFVCLTSGVLVHYSAAPFALFIGLHYLIVVMIRRPKGLREALVVLGTNFLLMATWLAWSIIHYGLRGTFATNTTVTDTAQMSWAQNIQRILSNIYHTLAPHPLTIPIDRMHAVFAQPSELGFWRDYFFLIYQTNLIFLAGSAGTLALLAIVLYQRNAITRKMRWFWVVFVIFNVFVGIAVVGSSDKVGLAHVCLQPLGLLAILIVAANFPRFSMPVRALVLISWLFDFTVGVLLQFQMEHRVFLTDASGQVLNPNQLLSRFAVNQFLHKVQRNWTFVGDLMYEQSAYLQTLILLLLFIVIWQAMRRTDQYRRSPNHVLRAGKD